MWIQVALFVVSLIVSYALQPKTQKPKPAAFEDFDFPTADEGTPQLVVFGDVWLTDWTVIGVGNYRNQPIVSKQSGIFGSSKTTTGYRYLMSLHMGLCRGINDLIEIKVSDRTLWKGSIGTNNLANLGLNDPNLFGGDKSEGGIEGYLKINKGASDQTVLPELISMYGVKVPAYRGVVTLFFDGLICSNSAYPKPWSFRVRRTTADWDGTVWYPEKLSIWLENNTIQAMNPAHILFEAQTNRVWGRGFSSSQLDLDSFRNVADQLYSEGFGMCLAWRRQEKLIEFIQQIVNTIGGILFLDRLTGLWKLELIRQDYNLDTLPSFNYTNGLLKIVDDSNSVNDVAANQTIVSYRDPISNEDKLIRAENIASIQQFGVISENKTYAGIPTSDIAGRIAARDMKVAQSNLKKFKLIFDRRAYAMQPMSVFKISLPERGINSIVLRAVRVDHDNALNGEITVTALQDVFGLPSGSYVAHQQSLWQAPDHRVVATNRSDQFRFFDASYYDMCSQFVDISQKPIAANFHYYAIAVKQPNSLHLQFKLWVRQRLYNPNLKDWEDTGLLDEATIGNYCMTAKIIRSMPYGYTQITVPINMPTEQMKLITLNSAALINNEVVRIDSVDELSQTVTLSRGCSDSLVEEHPVGSEIWFYDNALAISSKPWYRRFSPQYTNDIYYKVQNFTRYQETTIARYDAVDVFKFNFYSMLTRPFRPYPPAHVTFDEKILNQHKPCFIQPFSSIAWRNRNRLSQRAQLYSQSDESIDIETGCYTEIVISLRNLDGNYQTNNSYNLGDQSSVLIQNIQDNLFNHHAASIRIGTRNYGTAANDPSLNTYIYNIEFFGFGMNFGRHFGGHNG